jgi:hypothetical protein
VCYYRYCDVPKAGFAGEHAAICTFSMSDEDLRHYGEDGAMMNKAKAQHIRPMFLRVALLMYIAVDMGVGEDIDGSKVKTQT